MKKFINENWFKIIVILIMLFFFYWLTIRPSEIRKMCSLASMPDAAKKDLFWNSYKFCITNYGLSD